MDSQWNLRRLILRRASQTTLQKPLQDWKGKFVSVSVLVRGQGTTDGFHERLIPIPVSAHRLVPVHRPSVLLL